MGGGCHAWAANGGEGKGKEASNCEPWENDKTEQYLLFSTLLFSHSLVLLSHVDTMQTKLSLAAFLLSVM